MSFVHVHSVCTVCTVVPTFTSTWHDGTTTTTNDTSVRHHVVAMHFLTVETAVHVVLCVQMIRISHFLTVETAVHVLLCV